jgi:2-polyprenyl-6-methoxyphenol hydroxylase-like FAD-dependent oxidoreductase
MMDFFGTGWDVAARMGLEEALRAIRYPIDDMDYVDAAGRACASVPIARARQALADKCVYLRRPDLVRILFERAVAAGVDIRFGTAVRSLDDRGSEMRVTFDDCNEEAFALVFGADGVHSRVRELTFRPESTFARFLGLYVAAFHIPDHDYGIGRAVKLYEETDRLAGLYPLDARRFDATYVFRHADMGHMQAERRRW